jgi:hypothetical protein
VGVLVATIFVGGYYAVLAETADDAFRTTGLTPTASRPTGSTPTAARMTSSPTTASTAQKSPRRATVAASPAAPTTPRRGQDWEMVPLEVPESLAPVNEAVIENSTTSNRRIRICREWGNTSCRRSSRRGYLEPGENSAAKFRWADTDGFHDGKGWVKLDGCFGCVVVVTAR